jgi:hypothetical protein
MNRKQTIILWVGLAIFLLMGIFPPWLMTCSSGEKYGEEDAGYHCILSSPISFSECLGYLEGSKLDLRRLYTQWIIVVVATGGLIYTFRDKQNKKA